LAEISVETTEKPANFSGLKADFYGVSTDF